MKERMYGKADSGVGRNESTNVIGWRCIRSEKLARGKFTTNVGNFAVSVLVPHGTLKKSDHRTGTLDAVPTVWQEWICTDG